MSVINLTCVPHILNFAKCLDEEIDRLTEIAAFIEF